MRYNLQEAVDFILNENESRHVRAIRLFEFLVAIHIGKSRVQVCAKGQAANPPSNLVIEVSSKWLRAARLLIAMKILDQLETDWIMETQNEPRLQQLGKIPFFEQIYD